MVLVDRLLLAILFSTLLVFSAVCIGQNGDIASSIEIADDYYRDGSYYLALQEYNKILSKEPGEKIAPYIHLRMGMCFYKLGDFSRAADEFDRILIDYAGSMYLGEASFLSARAYFKLKNYPTSAARLLRVISLGKGEKYYKRAGDDYKKLIDTALTYEQIKWSIDAVKPNRYVGEYLLKLVKEKIDEREYAKASVLLYSLEDRYSYLDIIDEVLSLLKKVREYIKPEANKIGCLVPLSGPYECYGRDVLNGVMLALDGFHGSVDFELFVEDSRGTLEGAFTGFHRLTDVNRASCIIGPLFTNFLVKLSREAERAQVPLISPAAGSGDFKESGEFTFRCGITNKLQAEKIAKYAVENLQLKRIAILYPDNSYGRELDMYFKKYAEMLGARIVIEQSYEPINPGEEMTKSYVQEVKNVKYARPDAIFIPGHYEELVLITAQIGFSNIPAVLLGANGWAEERVARVGAKYVEGSYFTSAFFEEDSNPLVQSFIKEYYMKYKEKPSYISAQAFDTAKIVLSALSKGKTGKDLVAELSNNTYHGVTGRIKLRGKEGDCDKSITILTIREGEIIPAQTL